MNFGNLAQWMQVIAGVAGMLASIFQNAGQGASQPPDVTQHVSQIHVAATQIVTDNSTATKTT